MLRVTPYSMAQSALNNNRNFLAQMAQLQNQASSGLRYSRPSDNPLEVNRIGSLQRAESTLELRDAQIRQAGSQLNLGVSNLLEANNLVNRARQIALQAPSASDSEYAALATEIDTLIDRLIDIANVSDDGRYVFAGTNSLERPFSVLDETGLTIPSVQYLGNDDAPEITLSTSLSVQSGHPGSEVFLSGERGETLFLGNTGAAAGTGTSSEVGRTRLTVRNTGTTFAPGSGIASAADANSPDTIVGQTGTHVLTIEDTSGNGSAGTIRLNNGATVDWTNGDAQIEVVGIQGESVFVDTTAIVAGFNGDIDITATGSLSTDDGLTGIPIDFSGNQVVTNSLSGGTTVVDSTAVIYADVDHVEFTETADAFTALFELRDDLKNARDLDPRQLNEALARRLEDLDRVSDQLLDIVGTQSVALQDLQQLEIHNQQLTLDVQTRLADTQGADLAQVIVDLQSVESAMQFNFASLSILRSANLLDFLG